MSDAPTDQTEHAQAKQAPAEQPAQIAYAICAFNEVASQKARGFKLSRIDDDGTERAFNIIVIRWGKQVFDYVNPGRSVNGEIMKS